MNFDVSIDIGGTFTDLYLRDSTGSTSAHKSPTTPENLTDGLFGAIEQAANAYDISVEELLTNTERFIHGTTVSTNAIIEDELAETALITTEGFHDMLRIREGGLHDNAFDWTIDHPEPYIPGSHVFTVPERINAEGEVEVPLAKEAILSVAEALRENGVEAVAVSLLWAHENPAHERLVHDVLTDALPGVHISLSHEVVPIIREYRRTSATCINASIHQLVNEYFESLETALNSRGFEQSPLIVTANGGVMHADEVANIPLWTVDSGPTMLPMGILDRIGSELNKHDIVAVDMGGTSLDISVTTDGEIPRSRDETIGDKHMIGIDKVKVHSVGAGGGSIVWVDEGGLIHIGPESAGSDPGPACYGRGGTRPTLTDICGILGFLNESVFLGGEMAIDLERSHTAVEREIASPLGLSTADAAHAVYATSIQYMVSEIEKLTIEQGLDTKRFVLSGGGGALGMFIVPIARALHVEDVLLPAEAGVVCAAGGLSAPIRRNFSMSFLADSRAVDQDGVNRTLEELETKARGFLDRANIAAEDRELRFYAEGRYATQVWELSFDLPDTRLTADNHTDVFEAFHRAHERTYGYRMDDPVEILYWGVEARTTHTTSISPDERATDSAAADAAYANRPTSFDGASIDTPRYAADALYPGHTVEGPAVIDASNTTIVVPPESSASITGYGSYHIKP